jgi:hypothetical protein
MFALASQSADVHNTWIEHLHGHREALSETGHRTVSLLPVAPEIDEHYPAAAFLIEKTADAIGEVLLVNPRRPRPPPFRKNQQRLPPIQNPSALFEEPLELFAAAAAVDGQTLGQIAYQSEEEVPLKILPLRQVPEDPPKMEDMIRQRKHPIAYYERIDHGQVVRTDDPRPVVRPIDMLDFSPDPLKVADAIAHQANEEKAKRRRQNDGNSSQNVLQAKEKTIPSFHDRL